MRKLASVVRIATSDGVPDADRLSVVTMDGKGWRVVTGRDEFRPGDLAVYFEIDSYLPHDDARYASLVDRCLRKFCLKNGDVADQGLRIKTIRLRGVVSQGLVMPIGQFPEAAGLEVGADLTDALRVRHYDEIAEALRPVLEGKPVASDAMGPFPTSFIPKTDEERIQNLGHMFEDPAMRDREFEVTEKNDGMSVTVFYSPSVDPESPFGVCSRNLRLKPERQDGSVPTPWEIARGLGLEDKLRALHETLHHEFALQGELVGPGINGNRDMYVGFEWHVFKVWDITEQAYVLPDGARTLCRALGVEYVPVVNPSLRVFSECRTVDDVLAMAEGKTSAHGREREGLVFKPVDRPYVSFKAVSNRYLLKTQDK